MQDRENPTKVVAYHFHVPHPSELYELAKTTKSPLVSLMIAALNKQYEGKVTGKSESEPLYRRPNAVRYSFQGISDMVDVNFAGTIYRARKTSNGSMTFAQDESTVRLQHEGKYYLIYFKDSDVKSFGANIGN